MKNLLKHSYLFALTLILLFSRCEQDDPEKLISYDNKITIREIHFEDLLKEKHFKDLLKNSNLVQLSLQNRTSFENRNNFTISNKDVKILQIGNKTSYTMLIKRNNDIDAFSFENLIIQTDDQANSFVSILKYIPTEVISAPHGSHKFIGEIRRVNLTSPTTKSRTTSYRSNSCYATIVTCETPWPGFPNSGGHTATAQCLREGYVTTKTIPVLCPDWGTSSGDGSTGGSSGGGGGSTDDGGDGPILTSPVIDNESETNIKESLKFFSSLLPTQKNWITVNASNPIAYGLLINFQVQQMWSPESALFSKQIINNCIAQGINVKDLKTVQNIFYLMDKVSVANQSLLLMPTLPIGNMEDYLNCFDISQEAIITIYADQPVANSHSLISNTDRVGHAFISIKQGTKVKTLGFYPQNSITSIVPNGTTLNPRDFFSTPGVFGNDSNHNYDVSLSLPLSAQGLANTINLIKNIAQSNPYYNLGFRNCTDMAIAIFEYETILTFPNCESPSLWNGQTPGTLGEQIRIVNLPPGIAGVRNNNGGTSPANSNN